VRHIGHVVHVNTRTSAALPCSQLVYPYRLHDSKHPAQRRAIRLQLVTPLKSADACRLQKVVRVMLVTAETERKFS
jgi:hypothetical protein